MSASVVDQFEIEIRIARWSFQGIADSVKEGLVAGAARRAA